MRVYKRSLLGGALIFLSTLFYHGFQKPADVDARTLAQSLPGVALKGKIILGFAGTTKEDPGVMRVMAQLRSGILAGVILFPRNIDSPAQTKQLITDLKTAAARPIWVSLDQEGGAVQTLQTKKEFTLTLAPHEVANMMTPPQAYAHYRVMAKELAGLGFNLNFGCVLDLYSPKSPIIAGLDRSYSADPKIVATYAQAFVKAHRDFGITPCLKHYPGHGLAHEDSHVGLTDITLTKQPEERAPFRLMIQAGLADMIMSGHLLDRSLDSHDPVSLSKTILREELRGEDRFKGLIVTDDLHMGAIGDQYTLEEAVGKALMAGNDLLIISNNKRAKLAEIFYNFLRPFKNRLRKAKILS